MTLLDALHTSFWNGPTDRESSSERHLSRHATPWHETGAAAQIVLNYFVGVLYNNWLPYVYGHLSLARGE